MKYYLMKDDEEVAYVFREKEDGVEYIATWGINDSINACTVEEFQEDIDKMNEMVDDDFPINPLITMYERIIEKLSGAKKEDLYLIEEGNSKIFDRFYKEKINRMYMELNDFKVIEAEFPDGSMMYGLEKINLW